MSAWPGSPEALASEAAERRRLESVERWARFLVDSARTRSVLGLPAASLADVNALARALGVPEVSTHADTEVRT